jgi:uracil-DNA glycosylase family 4
MKNTFVPPNGPPDAKIALVGEQPGVQEIRGRPPRGFIGPAGQLLDECLSMCKISRNSCYITNVIKDLDAEIGHYIYLDLRKSKFSIHSEGMQYINELGEELKQLKPNIIVAFGNIPLVALTGRLGITKWHGSIIESTLIPGIKVIPVFHPSSVLHGAYLNKPLIVEDLQRAKAESEYPSFRQIPRYISIRPTFDEAIMTLNYAYECGLRGQTLCTDIEVINGEIDCFSIGWSYQNSLCIPLRYSKGDYFTEEQELQIMLSIGRILEDERISKVNANFIFDLQFYFRKYGIRPKGTIHCTQIAQKISFPDFPAGLDFVTNQYTDIPYYKADGKQWMKMGAGTWESWWNYNGLDGIVPVEAIPKQLEVLRKQGNLETYDRQRKLIEPLLYMGERGIRIDVQGMENYRIEQQKLKDQLEEDFKREVGHEINPRSSDQVQDYFYKECGLKPYKNKTTHESTADVDALKRIFRLNVKGSKAARILLDYRGQDTRISRYLNIGKIDPDGRYRSSYKPVGASTGRLSSGETIFGTGGNQQNWPHDLLRFFSFDEGYLGYSLDLSQFQNRIVAYVGGVTAQIKAFEEGIDLHSMTSAIIHHKRYEEISNKDGSSPLGDGRQSERYWGKKGNHAINFDVQYKTFALKNEMPEWEAKKILLDLHKGYPEIKGGYHALIQTMLKHNRTVINLFGRSRLFLGPIFSSYNTPMSVCEDTYREAYVQMAQSTEADKMNEQGVEFVYYNQQWFKPVEILAQIHDSLTFQIPLSIPFIDHARMVLMIKQSLETPLVWRDQEIPCPADLVIGLNMYKESSTSKEFKSKNIPNTPELLAEKIEETYNEIRSRQE